MSQSAAADDGGGDRIEQMFTDEGDGNRQSSRVSKRMNALHPAAKEKLSAATLLFVEGNFEASIRLLKEVIRLEPRSSEAFERLGSVHLSLGRKADALEANFFAASFRGSDANLWKLVAKLAEEVDPPQYDRARDAYTRLLRCYKSARDSKAIQKTLRARAMLKMRFGHFAKAAKDLEKLLVLKPNNKSVASLLAINLLRGDKNIEAINCVSELVAQAELDCQQELSSVPSGKPLKKSTRALQTLTQFVRIISVAHQRLGDHSRAFALLETAKRFYARYGVPQAFPIDIHIQFMLSKLEITQQQADERGVALAPGWQDLFAQLALLPQCADETVNVVLMFVKAAAAHCSFKEGVAVSERLQSLNIAAFDKARINEAAFQGFLTKSKSVSSVSDQWQSLVLAHASLVQLAIAEQLLSLAPNFTTQISLQGSDPVLGYELRVDALEGPDISATEPETVEGNPAESSTLTHTTGESRTPSQGTGAPAATLRRREVMKLAKQLVAEMVKVAKTDDAHIAALRAVASAWRVSESVWRSPMKRKAEAIEQTTRANLQLFETMIDGVLQILRNCARHPLPEVQRAVETARCILAITLHQCPSRLCHSKASVPEHVRHQAAEQLQLLRVCTSQGKSNLHSASVQALRYTAVFRFQTDCVQFVQWLCHAATTALRRPDIAFEACFLLLAVLKLDPEHRVSMAKRLVQAASFGRHASHFEPAMKELKSLLNSDPTNETLWALYVQLKHTYADKAAAMDRDRFVHRMIKSHGDSIAISMVRGGEYMSGRRIASSLADFVKVLSMGAPQDLVNLCLAIAFSRCLSKSSSSDEVVHQCCGALTGYKNARLASGVAQDQAEETPASTSRSQVSGEELAPRLKMEIAYNCGRAFQQMNLVLLSERCYVETLQLWESSPRPWLRGLQMDAAHNLSLLYTSIGNDTLATHIRRQYLTL